MSLNKLVGVDCGGNNSLVQLSNIVGRDATLAQPRSLAEQYVGEFLSHNTQGPQTFNMNSLLNSMPETKTGQIRPGPSSSSPQLSKPWIPGPSSFVPQRPMMGSRFVPHTLVPIGSPQVVMHAVNVQYVKQSDLQSHNVQAKAQEYVDQTQDDDNLAYNQFMSFMKKISAGETNFEAAQATEADRDREQSLEKISERYKNEWEKLSDITDVWDSTSNGISKDYEFAESNVMLENKSAFDLGKEKLKMGDVPGAVICFEAAAQQEPESAIVWFFLGSTQAENEQDPMAITALRKCISLDPTMQDAYLVLAAAYANENMPKHAYTVLLEWLKNSPKYNNLTNLNADTKNMSMTEIQNHIKNLYIDAARRDPENIDADVQNALGVVFNISQEYDKAVDCFKTALMVQNDNPQLWNRLGATLANSNRSEEAVEAYHEALNLEPGFVRARYNVGITCMNLGAHKQAAEHFLVALNQQHKAENMGPALDNATSPVIWMTLRMVCSYMGEHKIADLVDQRKLTELNKFFEIDA